MFDTKKLSSGQTGAGDTHAYKRLKRIEIRVSLSELELLRELAYKMGFNSIAQFIRETSLAGKHTQSPSKKQDALRKCHYELNKIGVNCNQLAHMANSGSQLDEEMLMMLAQVKELAENTYNLALGKE